MIYLISNQTHLFSSNLFNMVTVKEGIELLANKEELGLDTETTGLSCYTDDLLLIQFGDNEIQVLFDIASFGGLIPKELSEYLTNTSTLFILQNAKFDLKFFFRQNILIRNVFDTMLAETILTNGLQFGGRDLNSLTQKYCGEELDKSVRSEILNKGLTDRVLVYGANDVKYLPKIKRIQLKQATQLGMQHAINLDNSFVLALAYTEFCGIKLDFDKWMIKTRKAQDRALILKTNLEAKLLEDGKLEYFSGMTDLFSGAMDCILNWDSPKQVIALFKSYGIKVEVKKNGVSKETVDAKILIPQKNDFPILGLYLEYKGLQKEISTYGESWSKYINPETGRIHTTFKQLMDTGRLSCGNKFDGTPNLQNLPADDETRACFIPEPGCVMIDADYSGQEQIVLANSSKEENLINFYKKGFSDMHSYVTFLMYSDIRRCTLEELTPEKLSYIPLEYNGKRKIAKSAGFAINYGGNGSTIAKNCSITNKEGEFVYKSYFEAFPQLKDFFELGFRKAEYFGYVEFNNITKRKYFFDVDTNDFFKYAKDIKSPDFWKNPEAREINRASNKAKSEIQRLSQNYPIQGTSSDITKYACILLFREILKNGWWMKVKIVNLVHDEILAECPIEMVEEVSALVTFCMEEAGKPFCKLVPLKAAALSGDHWIH